MNDKKTLSEWAFDFKVRLLDEKFYGDKNLYTVDEYEKIVPRDVEVSLFGEPSDMNQLVIIQNGEISVAEKVIEEIKKFQKAKLEMDLKEKELKEALKEAMEKHGKRNFAMNGLSATYFSETETTTFDSKRFQEECPDIYNAYLKKGTRSSYITMRICD